MNRAFSSRSFSCSFSVGFRILTLFLDSVIQAKRPISSTSTPLFVRRITKSSFSHCCQTKMPKEDNDNRFGLGKTVITISVDGNISSGKSTLVSKLSDLFPKDFGVSVELIPEPLEKWTDLNGHNLLGMFYEDPVKYNFMFQNYVQLTRLIETTKAINTADKVNRNNGIVKIMERSLQNNRYVFTELARREGRIQPEEFAVLSQWHDWMEKNFDLGLDLIIYLRTSPETVFNRMKNRGREEESSVPLDYLRSLHEAYEDWLVEGKLGRPSPSPHKRNKLDKEDVNGKNINTNQQEVLVIDANKGKEEVASECQQLISDFMTKIGIKPTDSLSDDDNDDRVPNRKEARKSENTQGKENDLLT